MENKERIYIGSELPEEYTESERWKSLMGAKAKANAPTAISELIRNDVLAIKKKRASRSMVYGENPFLTVSNNPFLPSCQPPILVF